ncbi:hypothetical protein HRR90_007697 [Exophiala dermatitidis]|nr:hypothetical protein HRR90_007697 [Exophiala dermatitidis]
MKQTSLLIVGGYTLSVGALIPWGVIGPQYAICSLFLAVANILIGSTSKGETPQGLLVGYRNAIWSLVGFTSVGLASFVVLYMPGQSKKVVESQAAGTVNEPGSNKPEPLGEL